MHKILVLICLYVYFLTSTTNKSAKGSKGLYETTNRYEGKSVKECFV
jgi:hypothetical protein